MRRLKNIERALKALSRDDDECEKFLDKLEEMLTPIDDECVKNFIDELRKS